MSTIAARAHSSASLSAPVRRAAPQPRRKATWLGRVGRMAAHRPGRALVLLVFAVVTVAIMANALVLQKARHPAPIVSAPSQTTPARQAARAEQPAANTGVGATAPATVGSAAPLPPSRPVDLSQQPREASTREASARETVSRPPAGVTNVPRSAPAPAAAPRAAAARDPIADLINGADIRPPAEIRGVAQARSATARRSAEN